MLIFIYVSPLCRYSETELGLTRRRFQRLQARAFTSCAPAGPHSSSMLHGTARRDAHMAHGRRRTQHTPGHDCKTGSARRGHCARQRPISHLDMLLIQSRVVPHRQPNTWPGNRVDEINAPKELVDRRQVCVGRQQHAKRRSRQQRSTAFANNSHTLRPIRNGFTRHEAQQCTSTYCTQLCATSPL